MAQHSPFLNRGTGGTDVFPPSRWLTNFGSIGRIQEEVSYELSMEFSIIWMGLHSNGIFTRLLGIILGKWSWIVVGIIPLSEIIEIIHKFDKNHANRIWDNSPNPIPMIPGFGHDVRSLSFSQIDGWDLPVWSWLVPWLAGSSGRGWCWFTMNGILNGFSTSFSALTNLP